MTQQKSGYPLDYSQGDSSPKDRMGKLTDETGEQFNKVSQSAQDMAAQVAERAQEYGEMAQDAAKKVKRYVEQSLKENANGDFGSRCDHRLRPWRTLEALTVITGGWISA